MESSLVDRLFIRKWMIPLFIGGITFLLYTPSLDFPFLNWDDYDNFVGNIHYRGLLWPHLKWMWTTFHMGHYIPLTWMTFGGDFLLWGLNPKGYHLTNIVLHVINTLLFYFLCVYFLKHRDNGKENIFLNSLLAGFAALFFSLHPLRLESVVWLTERRDLLSAAFLFFSLFAYGVSISRTDLIKQKVWWGISYLLFICSLLSKAVGASFPLILLLLDFFLFKRIHSLTSFRSCVIEKIPFFFVSAIALFIGAYAQVHTEAAYSIESYGIFFRVIQSFYGVAFYVLKTFIPIGLSPLYEIPFPFIFRWVYILAIVFVVLLTWGLFYFRKKYPMALMSWVIYLLLLFPVLGFFQSGPQFVADRYSYLSCLVWPVLLVTAGKNLIGLSQKKTTYFILTGVCFLILGFLWNFSRDSMSYWQDSKKLWGRVLQKNPKSFVGYNYLGQAYFIDNLYEKSIPFFETSIKLNPHYLEAYQNLTYAYIAEGQNTKAESLLIETLRKNPGYAGGYVNLGYIYSQRGEFEKAIDGYQKALDIDPSLYEAHNNLGTLLAERGDLQGAYDHMEKAVDLKSSDATTYYNLAILLSKMGEKERAQQFYRKAILLDPLLKVNKKGD